MDTKPTTKKSNAAKKAPKKSVGADVGRDLSITKLCDCCGKSYHPRKNSYQATSRFCSAQCSRKGLRGAFKIF